MSDDLYRRHELELGGDGPLFEGLADALPHCSRRKAREAVLAGLVTVDGAMATGPMDILQPGMHRVVVDLAHGIPHHKLRAAGGAAPERRPPFQVLYEDDELFVVDKAVGILSAPGDDEEGRDHVLAMLRRHARKRGDDLPFLGVVHRIDLATSGCLVVARTRGAQNLLAAQFAGHGAGRRYTALVAGGPARTSDELSGRIDRGADGRRAVVPDDLPGKEALTRYTVIRRWQRASELTLALETGRTHQIRIHCAHMGCPILGDPVYGPRQPKATRKQARSDLPRAPRLMLHAHEVGFDHPRTGERLVVRAPEPAVFAAMRTSLGTSANPQERRP